MSVSAHGDRKHCSSITTAEGKKHHFHLTKRVRDPFHTTCCARALDAPAPRSHRSAARARQRTKSCKCAKHRFHKGFCNIDDDVAGPPQAVAEDANGAASAELRCTRRAKPPVKKNLGIARARALRKPESDANRANRLQVIRGNSARDDVLETGSRARDDIFSHPRWRRSD
jgi:hypothetical protein